MEPRPALERFFKHISIDDSGCWNWTGCRARGYGKFGINGRWTLTHRWLYQQMVGPIAAGLEPDHLCRNPACCNVEHLELVSHRENVRRGNAGKAVVAWQRAKTHCKHGHPYEGDNLRVRPEGWRVCRTCARACLKQGRQRRVRA